jgi:hypothetical protein
MDVHGVNAETLKTENLKAEWAREDGREGIENLKN